jgi:hypothetical protein
MERVLASGEVPAAIEFLDAATMEAAGGSLPAELAQALRLTERGSTGSAPGGAAPFVLLLEADGAAAEARRVRGALVEALGEGAGLLGVAAPRLSARFARCGAGAPGSPRALLFVGDTASSFVGRPSSRDAHPG